MSKNNSGYKYCVKCGQESGFKTEVNEEPRAMVCDDCKDK